MTFQVSKTELKMHTSELELLLLVKDYRGELILKNNRPIQPINNRKIEC